MGKACAIGFARQFGRGVKFVIPANAGIHKPLHNPSAWMPAFAGMTVARWLNFELAGKACASGGRESPALDSFL